ncbi:tyrosine-type recombinase/integrase [Aliifodinibius sp. S!AR15-10]|uniref:tyrosine-type recombinase/integrase n=1 Tax=Aliifodinibius sp. S!AR15-10 TaxID=2950437 RepID=UPI002856E51B|nr:tyrosine-type recombinase/integrase [Aliifodinibius sp. S!AR15-10]MDR8390966.1 tyrosine-type recombinase/integrase [Aliifodinibius sp. S!AR15-10]
MPKKKLTDEFIKQVTNDKNYSVEYYDTELKGLILRITPNGTKSFCCRYEFEGKTTRMTFGKYPAMDVEQARFKVIRVKQDVKIGRDPKTWDKVDRHENIKLRRKEEELVSKSLGTSVGELADKFKKIYLPQLRPITQRNYKGILERHILPELKDEPIPVTDKTTYIDLLDDIAYTQGHPSTANNVKSLLNTMLNFGVKRNLIDKNPAKNIPQYTPTNGKGGRDRWYRDDEIKKIWSAINELKYEPTQVYYKILFLTGQRRGETLKMKWADIDLENGVWLIPAEDTKGKRENEIPLLEWSASLIYGLKEYSGSSEYVFESPRKPNKGEHIKSIKYSIKSIRDNSGIKDFRPHDIRRTITTNMAKMKVPSDILGKILNHKVAGGDNSITAIYNRYSYFDEKREALQKWDRKLREIITSRTQ